MLTVKINGKLLSEDLIKYEPLETAREFYCKALAELRWSDISDHDFMNSVFSLGGARELIEEDGSKTSDFMRLLIEKGHFTSFYIFLRKYYWLSGRINRFYILHFICEKVPILWIDPISSHLDPHKLLKIACVSGNLEIVKVLLNRYDKMDLRCEKPIKYACINNRIEIIKFFISQGVSLNGLRHPNRNLKIAIQKGHYELADLLMAEISKQEKPYLGYIFLAYKWCREEKKIDPNDYKLPEGAERAASEDDPFWSICDEQYTKLIEARLCSDCGWEGLKSAIPRSSSSWTMSVEEYAVAMKAMYSNGKVEY